MDDLFDPRCRVPKPILQWDKSVKGFGIRLNCDGTRVFICKISKKGKTNWFTIGPVDLIRTEDARRLVQRMKLLARAGEDPYAVLKAFLKTESTSGASSITFGAFIDIYIEKYAKVYKKSWLKDQQRVKLYLSKDWNHRRLADITRSDFLTVFSKIGKKKHIAANRLKETVTTMFKQAIILSYLPADHPIPTFGVKAFKERPRKDKLTKDEMPRIAAALRTVKEPAYRHAILFIFLTGLRHGACIRARWDWFNFAENTMTVPGEVQKNEEPHTLPISPAMHRLLGAIRRFENTPYLFPSKRRPGMHISRLDKAWDKVRTLAKCKHIRIHDLRRSVGCMILTQTGSLPMVRDVLAHTNEHISAVYGFYDTAQIQPVMDIHGDLIERALGLDLDEGHPP